MPRKGKNKKNAKDDEDDWEADLDAIAAESGIERTGKAVEDFEVPIVAKKEKKKKRKAGEDDNEEKKVPEPEQAEEKKKEEEIETKDTEKHDSDEKVGKDDEVDGTSSKKEKTKEVVADDDEAEEVPETRSVKTAAQKKAEKKEKEKKRKKEAAAKAKKKSEMDAKKGDDVEKEEETKGEASASNVDDGGDGKKVDESAGAVAGGADDDRADDDGGDDDDGEDKKKKKKKKGKKEKKDVKAEAAKPSKRAAMIQKIKETQQKLKEEEERLKAEEEARIRAEEEKEAKRLEALRLEQERKERKKQRDREKKQRQKEAGTYLTPAQKQERARQQQMLLAMKAQGIVIPALEKKEGESRGKPVRYDTKRRRNKEKETKDAVPDAVPDVKLEVAKEEEQEQEEEEEKDKPVSEEEEETVEKNWDDVSSEDEIEVPVKKEMAVEKESATEKKKEEMKESSEDEESDDDDEEDEDEDEEDESDEEDEEEEDDGENEEAKLSITEKLREKALARIEKRRQEAEKHKSTDNLRAPVVCVLGHVDTGKTKILDKLRGTKVQDGEAGGITQQIGATNVPLDAIKDMTKNLKEFSKLELKLPGLLIIDTPGHESFSNLRLRGSSLCDIAILVVDIMHGLEPQTLESITLLKKRKTPFVVALNKIDRMYEWKRNPHQSVVQTLKKQKLHTVQEFDERVKEVILQFAEQGLNAALFHENKDIKNYVSLVPTSAISGDGMGDLIALIFELSQKMLAQRLSYSAELQCHVMEVKVIQGLGTTVDVVLVNGKLREGDTLVMIGLDGPFVSQARALLMPQPLKELRVKNAWVNHKEIVAAQGVKICGKDLEKALAGTQVFVAEHPDEVEILKEEQEASFSDSLKSIKLSDKGVYVQASTLGSLEALLEFLKTSKIPYAGVSIGPVHKKDVQKASVMLEHSEQYAVVLAFDVRVEREALELADSLGIKIFTAEIIYHLFDRFMEYREEYKRRKKEEFRNQSVFPCKLRILPNCIFNSRDPIVVGVYVEDGVVKTGTPLCVPSKDFRDIGVLSSIEVNHKTKDSARKGEEICVKIEALPGNTPELYGRHFNHEDTVVSKISRESIDVVKKYFRDEMQKADWQLMIELKRTFRIL
ncbi:eukaryotic translation initiation factor 5B-like [Oscarella lobularis]|uniref:eukaryotic translation initiation factor 5B-like n=1 Tax=Oscarella lobularis TaxID=121494 RepID=UPI003313B35D